jgi:3-oxoacyl-(acyl-carrier-protein) synthase III
MRLALADAGLEASALRRLILVTSTGGDNLIPASANHVAGELGLARTLDAFDINNACTGFLSALDVAFRSVATGLGPVGIVVVELLSRFIRPYDPRPYAVLGDGVAAAIVGEPRGQGCVLSSVLRNHPGAADAVALKHPALSGERETIRFAATNDRIRSGALELMMEATTEALSQAGCTFADIPWIVLHQPNGKLLDTIVEKLGVRESQMVRVANDCGSIGAASIPVGLDRLRRRGDVKSGDPILMVGVGAGASYGAMVLRAD